MRRPPSARRQPAPVRAERMAGPLHGEEVTPRTRLHPVVSRVIEIVSRTVATIRDVAAAAGSHPLPETHTCASP